MEEPWLRREDETNKSYEAFSIYRDMGAGRRFVDLLRALGNESKGKQIVICKWQKKYDWKERLRAYDNSLARAAHEEAVQAVKDMTRRHITIAMKMQKLGVEGLDSLQIGGLSAHDIKEFIKMGTELERSSRLVVMADKEKEAPTTNNQIMNIAELLNNPVESRDIEDGDMYGVQEDEEEPSED